MNQAKSIKSIIFTYDKEFKEFVLSHLGQSAMDYFKRLGQVFLNHQVGIEGANITIQAAFWNLEPIYDVTGLENQRLSIDVEFYVYSATNAQSFEQLMPILEAAINPKMLFFIELVKNEPARQITEPYQEEMIQNTLERAKLQPQVVYWKISQLSSFSIEELYLLHLLALYYIEPELREPLLNYLFGPDLRSTVTVDTPFATILDQFKKEIIRKRELAPETGTSDEKVFFSESLGKSREFQADVDTTKTILSEWYLTPFLETISEENYEYRLKGPLIEVSFDLKNGKIDAIKISCPRCRKITPTHSFPITTAISNFSTAEFEKLNTLNHEKYKDLLKNIYSLWYYQFSPSILATFMPQTAETLKKIACSHIKKY